jgi:hypothetical protein
MATPIGTPEPSHSEQGETQYEPPEIRPARGWLFSVVKV